MTETYSLVLNSQNTTNVVSNTSLSAYQYNINWDAILPRKYEKYNVTYQLKSANLQTSIITAVITTAGTLNVSAISGGSIVVGTQFLIGNVLQTITAFGTGTGGTGNYTVNPGPITGSATYYSLNTSLTQNVILSVNFGYTTAYEQTNSQSSVLGSIYPYIYPLSNTANISIFNYNSSFLDNAPIQIGYPSNQVITVRFSNLNGSLFTQMPHYQLQLYFEPIKE